MGLQNNPKIIVADFTASGCGPCQMIAPIFEKMAQEFPEVAFLKVDVNKDPSFAFVFGITTTPTFKLYKDGAEVGGVKGADAAGLRALLEGVTGRLKVEEKVAENEKLSGG